MPYTRGRGARKGTPVPVEEVPSLHQIDIFFRKLDEDFEPSVVEACKAANISKKQLELLAEKDAAFIARWKDFRDKQLDNMEDALFSRAQRDPTLALKLLQVHRPEKYGAKGKLDVTHRIGRPEDLSQLSDEEFADYQKQVMGDA